MLLGVSMALAFTMPINAAQYTVLEGQLPVPGVDASIPENTYQNYRYGDTSKVPDFEIKESLKLSFKEIDEIAREPEMSQVNINALKEANILDIWTCFPMTQRSFYYMKRDIMLN